MAVATVIDADGHVVEPDHIWREHLPRRLWPAAPRWVTDNEGRKRRLIGGRLQPYVPFPPGKHYDGDITAASFDPHARMAAFARHGIRAAVTTPSAGLFFAAVPETDVQAALCRAYNDWIAAFCSAEQSLYWMAVVPQGDVCALVEEAERALGRGASGVLLRPNPIAGRNLDDPAFDPLWDLLATADRPLLLHEATTMNVPEAGLDRFSNYLYLHAITQPHEHQMACTALICGGVLERHPGLRVAFFETGAGWVPYWLERLDQHLRYWGHASLPLPLRPSDYFTRQCFVSPFADEAMLPQVIERLGNRNLVFTSDFPMPYTTTERIADALLQRPDIDDDSKARIGNRNAQALYGLPGM
jgi:predicted TIM-barrel fold metal-dependent hydrolase